MSASKMDSVMLNSSAPSSVMRRRSASLRQAVARDGRVPFSFVCLCPVANLISKQQLPAAEELR
eukprot:9474753-Pyramimonas_sp.AAC.1